MRKLTLLLKRRIRRRDQQCAAKMEPLEARSLLAVVTWDGGANSTVWTDAANWDNDAIPQSGDDVILPASDGPAIRIDAGMQTVHSLQSDRPIVVTAGATLEVQSNAVVNSDLTIDDGTLTGGTWITSPKGISATSQMSNRLLDAQVEGNLNVGGLQVLGNSTFTTAYVSGPDSSIWFSPGYVLKSEVVLAGDANQHSVELVGHAGTLTIAPEGSIRSGAGLGGQATIGGENLINQGLLSAETKDFEMILVPDTLANASAGIIQAENGGTMTINSVPSNYDALTGTLTGGTWKVGTDSNMTLPFSVAVTTNEAQLIFSGPDNSIARGLFSALDVNRGSISLLNGQLITTEPASGTFLNEGELFLDAAAVFNVKGSFSASASSAITVVINGPLLGTDFGEITANEASTIAGSLHATVNAGFAPSPGEGVPVLVTKALTGTFTSFNVSPPSGGGAVALRYTAARAILWAPPAVEDSSSASTAPSQIAIGADTTHPLCACPAMDADDYFRIDLARVTQYPSTASTTPSVPPTQISRRPRPKHHRHLSRSIFAGRQ